MRLKMPMSCRSSMIESIAIMAYIHQPLPTKKATPLPFSVKMVEAFDEWITLANAIPESDLVSMDSMTIATSDRDVSMKLCSLVSLKMLCSSLQISMEELSTFVKEVRMGVAKSRYRVEQSSISGIIENAIAYEEGELLSVGHDESAHHLTMMKSELLYDLAEEVL